MNVFALTWEDVHKAVIELWRIIVQKEEKVDVVVPIARGGCTIGHLLSDLLRAEMIPFRMSSYIGTSKIGRPVVVSPPCYNFHNKNVILVDDVCDTGDSLKHSKKMLELLGSSSIKTLVLVRKSSCRASLDYWLYENDSWILFPWETKEVNQKLRNVVRDYLTRILGGKYADIVLGKSEDAREN